MNMNPLFCSGLTKSLEQSYKRSNKTVPPDLAEVARDYCCDGCYEPMFTGKSEFKFAYTFVLKVYILTKRMLLWIYLYVNKIGCNLYP